MTKFKVGFDIYGVSDIPQMQFRVRLCTCIYFRKELGVRFLEHVRYIERIQYLPFEKLVEMKDFLI